MRKLIAAVVVLAALYAGYWTVGRAQITSRGEAALSRIDAGPLDLSYDDFSVRGFPSRFDTTLTEPRLVDPAADWAWAAPWLQVFALSYRPNEVILLFPTEQQIALGDEVMTLHTADMRASARVRANTALSFAAATLDVANPRLRTSEGVELAMGRLLIAARHAAAETAYDVYAEASGVVLPDALRAALDPSGTLPPLIRELKFDGVATLSAPLDRHAFEGGAIRLDALDLRQLTVSWGDIRLSAEGAVAADAAGLAEGELVLTARAWRQALALVEAAGALTESAVLTYTAMAQTLDETPDDPETLVLTFRFEAGRFLLGDLPIGDAPRLH